MPSWRDCASTVPSLAQITPSSSKKALLDQPRAKAREAQLVRVGVGHARHRRAEVNRQVDRRCGRRLGQAHERRREHSVGEERQRQCVDRARLRQAEPAADLHGSVRAGEWPRTDARLQHDLASERRRPLERRQRLALGVGRRDLGHRQFRDLRRGPGDREGGQRQRHQRSVLLHARRQSAQRAPRALDCDGDRNRARQRRPRVVDRQRSRRPRRVVDRLDQCTQQHRREIAAMRAASGAPVRRHRRRQLGPRARAVLRSRQQSHCRVAVERRERGVHPRISHGPAACR
jgi:hypothetical protein